MVATLKINKKLIQKIKGKYINTNSCAPLVLRRFAESHELNTNFSLMIIVVMGTGSWVYNSTEGGASATADGTALPLFSNRRKRAAD